MHQLVRWAVFLHLIYNHVLTQHCTTFNLFRLLNFDPFQIFGVFFPTLTILRSNLVTLIP
jgi:hypothetical protein